MDAVCWPCGTARFRARCSSPRQRVRTDVDREDRDARSPAFGSCARLELRADATRPEWLRITPRGVGEVRRLSGRCVGWFACRRCRWSCWGGWVMSGERRRRLLGALAAAQSTGMMTALLSRLCAESTQLSGAEIMVGFDGVLHGSLCSSDEASGRLGDLQYDLGEGPAVDAIRDGRAVLEPDLANPVTTRWKGFTEPAVEAGAAAVFSFPLQLGAAHLGALDLYRDLPGPLTVAQHAEALFIADVATEAVLAVQAGAPPDTLASELEVGGHFHYVVQQAAGMVAVQLGVSVTDALIRLRADAYGNGRPLNTVARDLIEHRIRFDPHTDRHSP